MSVVSGETVSVPALRKPALWRRIVTLPWVLTAVYLVVCGTFIFRHALWRDEAQAFLLARDSGSLGELFWNLRYEGHPPLWHIMLWLMTRVTVRVEAMQMLHLLMAAWTVYLVARFAPFPVAAKVLFPFGYFPLFEYGIISRNYQLILLLAVGVCAMWGVRRQAYVRLGILLGLLALSHVLGLILAAGFGVMLMFDALATRRGRKLVRRHWWNFLLGMVVAAACTAWSVKAMIPPSDSSFAPGWKTDFEHEHNEVTLYTLWNGLVPLSHNSDARPGQNAPVDFWGNNILVPSDEEANGPASDPLKAAAHWAPYAGVAVILLVILSWRAMIFVAIAGTGLLVFAHVKLYQLYGLGGGTRHHGAFFVAVLMACWIAWRWRTRWPTGWVRRSLWLVTRGGLVMLLAVHVYAAWLPMNESWKAPFSMSKQTAEVLNAKMHPGETMVGPVDYLLGPLVAYMPGHPVFLADEGRWGTFTLWRRITGPRKSALTWARQIAQEKGTSVVVISSRQQRILGAEMLCEFTGNCVQPDETYCAYRIAAPVSR